VLVGGVLFVLYPSILTSLLVYGLLFRSIVCFFVLLPLGFLLGIPFPTAIQLLKRNNMEHYVPWMYGVNGTMSVLGSVLAVILSMQFGFTATFSVGLCFYLVIFLSILLMRVGSRQLF